MINFNLVAEIIEDHPEWQALEVNMEDGYIIYTNEDVPGIELTFADWDLLNPSDAGAVLRLTDTTHDDPYTGYHLCLIETVLEGVPEDELAYAVEDFFYQVDDALA